MYESMFHCTTAESTVSGFILETGVVLLVQDKHDTIVTHFRYIFSCYISWSTDPMVDTDNSLECLPHTGIIYIIE